MTSNKLQKAVLLIGQNWKEFQLNIRWILPLIFIPKEKLPEEQKESKTSPSTLLLHRMNIWWEINLFSHCPNFPGTRVPFSDSVATNPPQWGTSATSSPFAVSHAFIATLDPTWLNIYGIISLELLFVVPECGLRQQCQRKINILLTCPNSSSSFAPS